MSGLCSVQYRHRLRYPVLTSMATRCAVLTLAIVLRGRYAMSGTDIGYRATRRYPRGGRDHGPTAMRVRARLPSSYLAATQLLRSSYLAPT
eukprot:3941567-Rhodomonas_salina.3